MEIWKKVANYEKYEVSNFGRVKSVKFNKILTGSIDKNGYKYVRLNNTKHKYVARLVCEAFCKNPHNKEMVDHIDRNPANNHYSNLRFCSIEENCFNKSIAKNNTSGVTGVVYDKTYDKWKAQIHYKNKCLFIGRYETFEEAKQARLRKEKELFKEFSPN